jgi:hypothetical protein
MVRKPYDLRPLLGNRELEDGKDQRSKAGRLRLHQGCVSLRPLHLQELHLLNVPGPRPPFGCGPLAVAYFSQTSGVPVDESRVNEDGAVLRTMPTVRQRRS